MIRQLLNIWNKWGFELFLTGCVVLIITVAIIRWGKSGTYSKSFYYNKHASKEPDSYVDRRKMSGGGKDSGGKDSKGETECRRVLRELFNRPFNKCRPDFLRNPVTGGNFNLELDCFDSGMRLAVEYNGAQHYKYIPFFHRNKEHFLNQKYRDEMKTKICRDKGIVLIEVPYTVKTRDIREYLVDKLRKSGKLR